MTAGMPNSVRAFVAASPIQRAPIAAAVAEAAAALPRGARVLDAGAGEAPYRPLFAHCDYVTQDWPASVHEGAARADLLGDLHRLEVSDASFDAVICTEVLEHVEDVARVCEELRRIVSPGGSVLVTVPFVGELHEEPYDFRRFTSHGIESALSAAGFQRVRAAPLTGYFGTLAHVLRHAGLSTRPPGGRQHMAGRAAAFVLLCVSGLLQRAAPAADGVLDQRRALPVGWVCRGWVADSG